MGNNIKQELIEKIYTLMLSVSELKDSAANRDTICNTLIRSRITTERKRNKQLTFIDTPIYIAEIGRAHV